MFRDRLGDDVGRQRLMEAEGHLLLVLHAPPDRDQNARRGRLFWRSPDGLWKPAALKHGEHPVGGLLDEYEQQAAELDALEIGSTEASDYFQILTRLTPLVRSAHNLHGVVQEARSAVKEDRGLILLRDRAYALSRRLELLQQDAKNTLDFVIAQQAESQSKAAHRLNILAALFFPLATLTAIFGMELRHGLEPIDQALAPLPMLGLIAVGLGLGVALAAFVSRK